MFNLCLLFQAAKKLEPVSLDELRLKEETTVYIDWIKFSPKHLEV